jgi:hypothetical protein
MGMQCTFSFADLLATAGGVDLSYEFVEEAQGDTPDSPLVGMLMLIAVTYDMSEGIEHKFPVVSPEKNPYCYVDRSAFDVVLPYLTKRGIPFTCA